LSITKCLEWLKEHHTDVIIVDYQMPIMDGLRLLERVQSSHNGHTPRVIMLSGFMEDKEKLEAVNLGAYAIIDKPCKFLLGHIEVWCSQNPAGVYSKFLLFFMILPGPASPFQTFVHSH
jgi:DNA-binding response OmpR family regulator